MFHHFSPRSRNTAKIDKDRKEIILTLNLTCNLTLILTVGDQVEVHIFQHDAKIGAGGMEFRAQLLGVAGELFRLADDFPQTAAAALHKFHSVEQISNDWITAHGADRVDVAILDRLALKHAARRLDLQPVVVHVDVDLAAAHNVVPMDRPITSR